MSMGAVWASGMMYEPVGCCIDQRDDVWASGVVYVPV